MYAGPHLLNMRHRKYHEVFCILRMVATAHSVYLEQMVQIMLDVPVEYLVFN
jgi:hypothetical protein